MPRIDRLGRIMAPLAGLGALVTSVLGFICLGGTGPYLANHWGTAYGVGLAAVVGICLAEAALRTVRDRTPPDRYSGLDRATEYLGLVGVLALVMAIGAWFGLPMAHGGSVMIYNGHPVVWDHGPVRSLTMSAYRRMNIQDQSLFLFPSAALLVAAGYLSRGLMFRSRRSAEETPVHPADPPFGELARRLHETVSSPSSHPGPQAGKRSAERHFADAGSIETGPLTPPSWHAEARANAGGQGSCSGGRRPDCLRGWASTSRPQTRPAGRVAIG